MVKIRKIIDGWLGRSVSPIEWSATFLSVIGVRIFLEFFVAKHSPISPFQILIEYLHNFLFFILAFLSIWLILAYFIEINPKKMAFPLILASFLIILPPVLDMVKTKGGVFWSFYVFGGIPDLFWQFLTFFGHLPSGIVYFGTRIIFILATLGAFSLVFLKTCNFIKAFLSAFLTYVVFFVLGSLPSWLSIGKAFILSEDVWSIKSFNVAQFSALPYPIFGINFEDFHYALPYNLDQIYFPLFLGLVSTLFLFTSRYKWKAMMGNLRLPQLFYHSGLLFIGVGLGYSAYPENFNLNIFSLFSLITLWLSLILAWEASVVVNDIFDFKIDTISNPDRPLQKGIFTIREYAEIGLVSFGLSVLGGLIVAPKMAIILVVYQSLAFFYSAKPVRLKRFLGIATLVSSLASILILFLGFVLVSGRNDLIGLSPRIVFLLMIAYTLCLPIKDFKDIPGDKADGVRTVPVVFGEEKGRLIVAVGFFISYLSSVFFLNEMRLFYFALVFGAASFLVITNKKIKPERLLWWNIGIVFVYGLILVKIVFLF